MTPTWPTALLQLGITVAYPDLAKDDARRKDTLLQLETKTKAFRNATMGRPFGNTAKAIQAAEDLASWANTTGKALQSVAEDPKKTLVDGQMALRLLHQLCEMGQSNTLDYDSARQVAWAFRSIYNESHQINAKEIPDPQIPKILESLDKQFTISLPSAGKQDKILDTLMLRLKSIAEFDPLQFQAKFSELQSHLPAAQVAKR